MSRVVLGAAVMIALGCGAAGYGAWLYVDGLVLLDRGVEVAVTSATSRYRRGTTVIFDLPDGRVGRCNVQERPPLERIVVDPEDPARCRVPEAVGGVSAQELSMGIMGLALALAGVVPLIVSIAMNAAKDDLDRML